MTHIPSITFQPCDALALVSFNHRLLRDCGLGRSGEDVVAAADDPRMVRVSRPSLLGRLFKAAQTAMAVRLSEGPLAGMRRL
jgi:hypothetical protein